jgi:DNA-binding SARP family transcriptional activator
VPLGGKLARALLATMLVHTRQVRTADQLIDDLWAEGAPPTARASLHNLVSALRRTLGHERLETCCGGGAYVLAIGDDQLDRARFERLLAQSRRESAAEKVRTLEDALALWRGSPLVDIRYAVFAQAEIRRLEELQVSALEELLAAKLELGSCAVVPELQQLVDGFPFREGLRVQLMVALHRSGRSVDALATYAEWRRILDESWGMEPSHAIQQVRADIVAGVRRVELATSA